MQEGATFAVFNFLLMKNEISSCRNSWLYQRVNIPIGTACESKKKKKKKKSKLEEQIV